MVDAITRQPALDAARLVRGEHAGAALSLKTPLLHYSFRGAHQAALLAGAALDMVLPTTACHDVQGGHAAALWLGPDEWLLIAATDIEPALAAALRSHPYALVSIGHRHTTLCISGNLATRVLSAGCPLDLTDPAFTVGMCTRTVLAKAEIIVWKIAPYQFDVMCWRSFAPYVWDFLVEARARQ